MDSDVPSTGLRIGELSRRVGVSDHVLRAWESRYGLLRPVRSAGGFRLYSPDDETRVRRMQAHLERGLSAAQAASAALSEENPAGTVATDAVALSTTDLASALTQALDEYDEATAQAALDRLLSDFTVETVLRDVVMPYLHELGARWESGSVSVAQEHFASNLLRGRLTGLARGWGNGRGPHALLACPPGELHDLGLVAFGIALSRLGWRVSYLGVSTPSEDILQLTKDTRPDLVVLAATTPARFVEVRRDLAVLAELAPLAIAGAGASKAVARDVGARLFEGDPVGAAQQVAGGAGAGPGLDQ